MVAKSYEALQQQGEPFVVKGRSYVNVITKTGAIKTVRWYTESEYRKMYPETAAPIAQVVNQKQIFGFTKGYITIFKGAIDDHQEWFKLSNARYATMWGWYVISTEEVPSDVPSDITPIKLMWDDVSVSATSLKPQAEIIKIVEALQYDATPSKFVGTVGASLETTLTIQKAIPIETAWGIATLHVMSDECENIYIWQTTARQLVEGNTYLVRGRVKEHRTYKGTNQTVLTNCTIGG